MKMNIHDFIRSKTVIDITNQVEEGVAWSAVVKNEKKIVYHGRGERPYHLDTSIKKHHKKSPRKRNAGNQLMEENLSTPDAMVESKKIQEPDFSHILPAVRVATGGYNVFSNDAIQRRMKERYQKNAEQQKNQTTNDSPDATYVTASSGTNESFKTAPETGESTLPVPAEDFEEEVDKEEEFFKKNACMRAVVHASKVVYPDDESYAGSDEFLDASESTCRIEDALSNLELESDPTSMYQDRVGLLFRSETEEEKVKKMGQLRQSKRDKDLYVHPLQEGIRDDPEWQSFNLTRRGTETTQTPRQYYMNIKDDDFGWE